MISDALFEVIYNVFMFLMGGFQPFHFNVDVELVGTVRDFLSFIFFILPAREMLEVFPLILLFVGFRIFIAFVKTVWDILPFT